MTTTLDFDARYSVADMPGVAFYLRGYATETVTAETESLLCEDEDCAHDNEGCWYEAELETVERDDMVRAVMVGDDREHVIDIDNLTVISDEDYCADCGQIGYGHRNVDMAGPDAV